MLLVCTICTRISDFQIRVSVRLLHLIFSFMDPLPCKIIQGSGTFSLSFHGPSTLLHLAVYRTELRCGECYALYRKSVQSVTVGR